MKPEYAPTLFEVANKSSDVQVINYPRGLDTYSGICSFTFLYLAGFPHCIFWAPVPILEGPLERARDLGVQGALSEPIMRAGMPNDAVMIHVYPVYVGVYPTMNTTEVHYLPLQTILEWLMGTWPLSSWSLLSGIQKAD